ncbi:TonB-dependent receptor [Klebsiella pneumoniae]|nr:TonB-dependent receptor [Klebsiella pneumoniae]
MLRSTVKEGATKRTNFSLNGPLSDSVSFNLWGNLSKTQADAQDINAGHEAETYRFLRRFLSRRT